MKITGKKLLVFSLLLAVIVILGAILYYLSLTRANNCEHHAEVNQRFNEMLVLVRVENPQYLADNPDTSTKEFAEYCKKIRNEREFYINSDLEHWKNPDQKSEITAICDCSSVNAGYIKFNGEGGQ